MNPKKAGSSPRPSATAPGAHPHGVLGKCVPLPPMSWSGVGQREAGEAVPKAILDQGFLLAGGRR